MARSAYFFFGLWENTYHSKRRDDGHLGMGVLSCIVLFNSLYIGLIGQ